MWGCGAACLTFEVWDFATPVEIRASPFKLMKFIKYGEKELGLADSSMKEIKKLLSHVRCKLIGSIAIPMIGKEEIDILVVSNKFKSDFMKLIELGYKGNMLTNRAYLHKKSDNILIEIHLMKPSDKMIKLYDKYIDILRKDGKLKKKYEKFKLSSVNLSSKEYKLRKADFIGEYILNYSNRTI